MMMMTSCDDDNCEWLLLFFGRFLFVKFLKIEIQYICRENNENVMDVARKMQCMCVEYFKYLHHDNTIWFFSDFSNMYEHTLYYLVVVFSLYNQPTSKGCLNKRLVPIMLVTNHRLILKDKYDHYYKHVDVRVCLSQWMLLPENRMDNLNYLFITNK